MSYTMLDWLGDQTRDTEPFNKVANEYLVRWMREDGRAIVRLADIDTLVEMAASQIDIDDEKVWEDDATANIAMAIGNWRKERADWVP